MNKKLMKFSVCCMAAGMVFAGSWTLQADAAEADMTGELIFAQCEEYINVRSDAGKKSDIVAKIYHNDSATVTGQKGKWYQIQSGNVIGYVKAKYFATGAEADAIAEEVAYRVAVVHPEELNVRMEPYEDAEVITVASQGEELETVANEDGWVKVALGNDVYGYVHADYVELKTYYPTAETPEEEAARLAAEQEAQTEDTEDSETWTDYTETESVYTQTEPSYTETEPSYAETEPVYEDTTPDDTYTEETEAPQTEAPQTEAPQTEAPQTETEPVYEDNTASGGDDVIYDADTGEYVGGGTYDTQVEPSQTEAADTTVSDSSTGQQIADYALQFVGNPYVWGGTSLTEGADCSGFTQSVFGDNGIGLARTAQDQSYGGTSVDMSSLQAGDLLFYGTSGAIDHVAIYIGGGQIVHAANPNSGITVSNYDYATPVSASRYW